MSCLRIVVKWIPKKMDVEKDAAMYVKQKVENDSFLNQGRCYKRPGGV